MADDNTAVPRDPNSKKATPRQRPRGWERAPVAKPDTMESRATFRIDAPSPSEEVLAQHDAELIDVTEPEQPPGQPSEPESSQVTCF